jgi:polysaccharide pyruvyl transferase WcaK-like protein
MSLPQVLAFAMGKLLVLLPQTVAPVKGATARRIARFILNNTELVYTRDRDSMKDVIDCLGADAVLDRFRFCYDVGFALEPKEPT